MMTYQQAANVFAKARSKDAGKRLENNTRLVKIGEDFAIVLHSTPVVTIHADGTYTLRSGGWETVTTKDRINEYSPARIWQRNFVWYLANGAEFFSGIRVDATGNILSRQAA